MPTYKLKSLLYLLVFILCAWVYSLSDTEDSQPTSRPLAEISAPQNGTASTSTNDL